MITSRHKRSFFSLLNWDSIKISLNALITQRVQLACELSAMGTLQRAEWVVVFLEPERQDGSGDGSESLRDCSLPGNRPHDAQILIQSRGGQTRREQSACNRWGPKYSTHTHFQCYGVTCASKVSWKHSYFKQNPSGWDRKKNTQEIKISALSTTSAQKTYLQHHLLPV